jgi:hypothetical protein
MGDNPPVTPADYARLWLLAALWGGAFVFLRVAAPVLGPVWTRSSACCSAGSRCSHGSG